jgi:two-component system, OmpR family, sensor histidine kinase KdpD
MHWFRQFKPEVVAWVAALGGVTIVLLPFRGALNEAHIALAYLLIVQGGSARQGRGLGLLLAALAFLGFDWFFLQPYGTLVIAKAVDWAVLAAFMITSVVAAQLFERVRAESSEAKLRASELDRLSLLGAETLNAPRAENALAAIVGVIHSALALESCAVYVKSEGDASIHLACIVPEAESQRERIGYMGQVERALESGCGLVIRSAGIVDVLNAAVPLAEIILPPDSQEIMLPLSIRSRALGVLVVTDLTGLELDTSQRRFLDVLSYYAALAAERVELVATADHADLLRETSKLKDAMLASVSHDLRTPLTTIKALAHDLASDGDERASTIEEEADRLNAMVADLLDLSRLNSGSMDLRPEPNEAEDLIGAALQRVSGTAGNREFRVTFEPGDPLLLGRFDFAQSLRLLVNLLENAIKYSPPTAPVDIAAGREGRWLAFSVSDRGAGIPASEAERVFEPFYRPPGMPPDVRGAGLGLSIARGLAEAQGGTLRYQPRRDGGSTFILQLEAMDLSEVVETEKSL